MGMNEENYVKQAEIAIKEIREAKNKYGKPIKPLTTSQIRNILAVTADIYNEIMNQTEGTSDELSKDVCARINYLKVRLVYESGRDEKVKVFVEKHIYYSFWSQLKETNEHILLFADIWKHWWHITDSMVEETSKGKRGRILCMQRFR